MADIRAVAVELADSAFLLVPEGSTADWAGFVQAPLVSTEVVRGVSLPAINNPDRSLVVGDEGVSLVGSEGAATVAFADCVVLLAWPDGGRALIGADGMGCALEPTLYPLTREHLATIERAVPQHLMVPMPARTQDRIPVPPDPPAESALAARVSKHLPRRLIIALAFSVLLLVALFMVSIGVPVWIAAATFIGALSASLYNARKQ